MKKFVLYLIVFLVSNTIYAQCCPYIDSVEIIPVIPNEAQETKVILTVTTPNLGSFINSSFEIEDNNIEVQACYYSGILTALQTYVDTVNLGYLTAGDYTLNFIAQQSDNEVQCNASDSQTLMDDFTVSIVESVSEIEKNNLKIYPNPSQDGIVNVSTELMVQYAEVFDQSGKRILLMENINETGFFQLNLSDLSKAIYIIKLYDQSGLELVQEVVLQ